nr:TfoX/Sxy family protein [uncultured Cohaesibacter sp.]
MSTDPKTIELLLDRLTDAGDVTARKMFGEYGLYCDGVFIGVVCDDNFHIKPTKQTASLTKHLESAPAYPGAKPSPIIPAEMWDEQDWLEDLVRATTMALGKKK